MLKNIQRTKQGIFHWSKFEAMPQILTMEESTGHESKKHEHHHEDLHQIRTEHKAHHKLDEESPEPNKTHGHLGGLPHKAKKKPGLKNLITILGIIVGVILIINIIISGITINKLNEKLSEGKELSKPVDINLFVIKDTKCSDCFDSSPIIDSAKKSNVNIKNEETMDFSSEKAKALIEKYSINRLPAVIVQGNTSKLDFLKPQFETKTDAMVFAQARPPYTDTLTREVKGRVAVTKLIDSSCKECSNVEQLVLQLRQNGIIISLEKGIDIVSAEGKSIIERYGIKKAPTIILSSDASEYELIKSAWPQLGIIASDGSFVLTSINPPYRDIGSNEVKGFVEMAYLTDSSCKACYNVSEHKAIIANSRGFNIYLSKENYIDISESKGKELIDKYNITFVPTIILSEDASLYQALMAVWRNVGTIEKDGAFVFRNVAVMGSYKDLAKNEVVNPPTEVEG